MIFCEVVRQYVSLSGLYLLAAVSGQEKLPMKYDLVRVDLQPSEPHKSVRTCGRTV